ncbi:MAG TPA: hypothetical protein VNN81_02010, partial [Bradyrhizobium sp.]|nr:hypothetical protein [Bradyrhizobium sp.]
FPGSSIFDFCNNICQKQTCRTSIPRLLIPLAQRAQASVGGLFLFDFDFFVLAVSHLESHRQ